MKLYIVAGMTGGSDRRDEWTVAAYLDEAKARRHAELATRWYREHAPPRDCEDWGWWSRNQNPYDSAMRIWAGEPRWIVRSTYLREELPDAPEAELAGDTVVDLLDRAEERLSAERQG